MKEKTNSAAGQTAEPLEAHREGSVSSLAEQAQHSAGIPPCSNCLQFFLRGHLEGQAHARLTDEEMADKVARQLRALELEQEANRSLARRALVAIDIHAARNAPDSTYVPMRRADGAP